MSIFLYKCLCVCVCECACINPVLVTLPDTVTLARANPGEHSRWCCYRSYRFCLSSLQHGYRFDHFHRSHVLFFKMIYLDSDSLVRKKTNGPGWNWTWWGHRFNNTPSCRWATQLLPHVLLFDAGKHRFYYSMLWQMLTGDYQSSYCSSWLLIIQLDFHSPFPVVIC